MLATARTPAVSTASDGAARAASAGRSHALRPVLQQGAGEPRPAAPAFPRYLRASSPAAPARQSAERPEAGAGSRLPRYLLGAAGARSLPTPVAAEGPEVGASLEGLRSRVRGSPDGGAELLREVSSVDSPAAAARRLAASSRAAARPAEELPVPVADHTGGPAAVRDDTRAQLANALLGTRAFTLGGDIFLGPGHDRMSSYVRGTVLPHELVHAAQQSSRARGARAGGPSLPRGGGDAEQEARSLGPAVAAGRWIHPGIGASLDEPQGVIWWVVAGVAAIWFFAGESVANAPGYDRETGLPERTIPNPTVGEYVVDASLGTALFVCSGPAGGFARQTLTRSLFAESTSLMARLVPASAQGATSFGMFDMAIQSTLGRPPLLSEEYNPYQTLAMSGVGALAAPLTAGSAFYLLRAPAGGSVSTGRLVVYYGTNIGGHGLIGATAMQTIRPEHHLDEFLFDAALFGLGGGLMARAQPTTLVVTDPNAFVVVDQAGELGAAGEVYVAQRSGSVVTLSRVGNFPEVVEAGAGGGAPGGGTDPVTIVGEVGATRFSVLDTPLAMPEGAGMQPVYALDEMGNIRLVPDMSLNPTTGGLGSVEVGGAPFRTLFPPPSLSSEAAWAVVERELRQLLPAPGTAPATGQLSRRVLLGGSGGRAVGVTVRPGTGGAPDEVTVSISGNPGQVDQIAEALQARLPSNYRVVTGPPDPTSVNPEGFRATYPAGRGEPRSETMCAEPKLNPSMGEAESMTVRWFSDPGGAPREGLTNPETGNMYPCEGCRSNSDRMVPYSTSELPAGSPELYPYSPLGVCSTATVPPAPEEEEWGECREDEPEQCTCEEAW